MIDIQSPDLVKQLRALAESPVASTAAYASDLRMAASEIERLRNLVLEMADSLDDYSPFTGRTIETHTSRAFRAVLDAKP